MNENLSLSREIQKIIEGLTPQPTEMSFALIDLSEETVRIAGFNMDQFIYPASVWKVFIAAEIMRKVENGVLNRANEVEIVASNKSDGDIQFFPSGSKSDHRPALQIGDRVSIGYLVDLMLTRSDNVASNVLMRIASREDINTHIILANGWNGSEVTNAHVASLLAQPTYQFSKVTLSTARHLAELLYKIETDQLVNEGASRSLKGLMKCTAEASRADLYLPEFKSYYRKGGWLEIDESQNGDTTDDAVIRWVNDAGVVKGANSHYAVAMLTRTNSRLPAVTFPIEDFSRKIYQFMESRKK